MKNTAYQRVKPRNDAVFLCDYTYRCMHEFSCRTVWECVYFLKRYTLFVCLFVCVHRQFCTVPKKHLHSGNERSVCLCVLKDKFCAGSV